MQIKNKTSLGREALFGPLNVFSCKYVTNLCLGKFSFSVQVYFWILIFCNLNKIKTLSYS